MRPEPMAHWRAKRQTATFCAQRVDHGPQLEKAIEPVLLDVGLRDAASPELAEGRNSSVSHPCGHHVAVSGRFSTPGISVPIYRAPGQFRRG